MKICLQGVTNYRNENHTKIGNVALTLPIFIYLKLNVAVDELMFRLTDRPKYKGKLGDPCPASTPYITGIPKSPTFSLIISTTPLSLPCVIFVNCPTTIPFTESSLPLSFKFVSMRSRL